MRMPTEDTPDARAPAATSPGPSRMGPFLVGTIGPVVTVLLLLVVAPGVADARGAAAIRTGGIVGIATALCMSLIVGGWMARACRRGGSAFLAPLAGGFLAKLVVLALGTWLIYGPLEALGSHIAFALAFAVAAFAFQILFIPRLGRLSQPGVDT